LVPSFQFLGHPIYSTFFHLARFQQPALRVQKLLSGTCKKWVFKNRSKNSKIINDNVGFLFRLIFILWRARWGALFLVADSCRLIGQISAFSHINRFQ
jgi:hypothetical protein